MKFDGSVTYPECGANFLVGKSSMKKSDDHFFTLREKGPITLLWFCLFSHEEGKLFKYLSWDPHMTLSKRIDRIGQILFHLVIGNVSLYAHHEEPTQVLTF